MQKVIGAVRALIIVLALLGLAAATVMNYSFIFSRKVKGEILEVERVTQPAAILGNATSNQIYSFAVAIKEPSGEIVTASSEDRQWAIAKKGFCVEARFYPYPPWDLDKSDTYFNARLVKLSECSPGASSTNAAPPAAPDAQK